MSNNHFAFKQFTIYQDKCAMKVGTDGVLLGAWAEGGNRILDIGCGTGLISLMMAQRFPFAQVVGIDVDDSACCQAAENINTAAFQHKIKIEHSPLQTFHPTEGLFDSIVSNPPFFTGGVRNPDQRRNIARHADTLTYRDLFVGVNRLLSKDGVFSAVIPTDYMYDFTSEAFLVGLHISRRCLIHTTSAKPPRRCLIEFSHSRSAIKEETHQLMESNGARSEWYKSLTSDFYLDV